jgi:hypothetical protein
MYLINAGKAPAGGGPPAYTGPGDLAGLSGAYSWWGFRAYNNAYISGVKHLVDIADASNANPTTIDCDATGAFDIAAYNTWATAHSVSAGTALVRQLYDQTGNGRHLAQSTAANMPTLNPAGVTSMSVNNSFGGRYLFNGGITLAQPFSTSAIANRVTTVPAGCIFLQNGNTGAGLGYDASVPPLVSGGGTLQSSNPVTLGVPSAMQFLIKGAGSVIYLDGTATSATSSTLAFAPGGDPLFVLSQTVDVVKFTEAGLWAGDVSGASNANFAALNTNQHAAYGGF